MQDNVLPETGGFFFGQDSFSWEDENGNDYEGTDYYYKETDLKFIAEAREAIQKGLKVFYNCWW